MIAFASLHPDLPLQPTLASAPRKKGGGRIPTGRPVRQRLLEGLARWLESGRHPSRLPRDWEYLAQSCWVFDHGDDEDLPAEIHEYILAAGDACGTEKYDLLLREEGTCEVCGETALYEHLAICADCFATRCRTCLAEAAEESGTAETVKAAEVSETAPAAGASREAGTGAQTGASREAGVEAEMFGTVEALRETGGSNDTKAPEADARHTAAGAAGHPPKCRCGGDFVG